MLVAAGAYLAGLVLALSIPRGQPTSAGSRQQPDRRR
jgi:hypothetical protein